MQENLKIISLNRTDRTVTFEAYGIRKTITGLGEFESEQTFIEFLRSVAKTDIKPEAVLSELPDMTAQIGKVLPNIE